MKFLTLLNALNVFLYIFYMQYISLFFGETIKKMKFVGRPLHIGSSKNKTNKFKGGIVEKIIISSAIQQPPTLVDDICIPLFR